MLIILLEIFLKKTFKENINITLTYTLILSHFYFIFKEEGIYFLPQPLLVFLYKEERAGEGWRGRESSFFLNYFLVTVIVYLYAYC
jgi:hypothetical protein